MKPKQPSAIAKLLIRWLSRRGYLTVHNDDIEMILSSAQFHRLQAEQDNYRSDSQMAVLNTGRMQAYQNAYDNIRRSANWLRIH